MKRLKWFWFIIIVIGLAACVSTPPQPEMTPRPVETRIVVATVTPQPTPTATIPPTPTAAPLFVFDGLRARRSQTPQPQRGAPCGVVDFFDFPLAAPDGQNARAPWPFGHYSDRYNGIHAGEDWIYLDGDSLGKPVYSIGHGTVLYAQPLGWGVDQGTIIVRHVFTNGKTILSFYGHLEPDSVTLKPGTCVQRGEQIGRIGKPRTRPHLHFEIRSIYPDQPGPGYWPVDPQLAGWKPPTEYIWDQRLSTSPGVKWTRPLTTSNSLMAGLLVSDTLAVIDADRILALEAETGRVRWSHPFSAAVSSAVVADSGALIYLTTFSNTLQAIDAGGELRWQLPFTPTTRSVLLPSPDGSVIVHDGRDLINFSSSGNQTWRIENVPSPIDWLNNHGDLLFTTGGDQAALYRLARSGQLTQVAALGGRLAASPDHLFLYAPDALYRLSNVPTLLKSLDRAVYNEGNLVTLPDDSVILSHHGVDDRRLIMLRPDGSLRWERSLRNLTSYAPHLIAIQRDVYAVTEEGDVWWIDQEAGEVQRVLHSTRLTDVPGGIRAFATANGTLIVDARGGRLVAFDPREAFTANVPDDRPPR